MLLVNQDRRSAFSRRKSTAESDARRVTTEVPFNFNWTINFFFFKVLSRFWEFSNESRTGKGDLKLTNPVDTKQYSSFSTFQSLKMIELCQGLHF